MKALAFLLTIFICAPLSSMNAQPKKKIVCIGASGKKGTEYINIIRSHNLATIVGFIHAHPSKQLKTMAQETNTPIYTTVSEACKQTDFDGALVTVPHYLHTPYVLQLLTEKKFIIKDKPLTMDMDELENLQLADDAPLFTIVQRQFNPACIDGLQKENTDIKSLRSFDYTYHLGPIGQTTGWRADKVQSGGGVVLDMGYHAIDRIVAFFGAPKKVEATFTYNSVKTHKEQLEDTALIKFYYISDEFPEGSITLSRNTEKKEEFFKIIRYSEPFRHEVTITPMTCTKIKTEGLGGSPQTNIFISDATKESIAKTMLQTYLAHVDNKEYRTQHLAHHKTVMKVIHDIYQSAVKK